MRKPKCHILLCASFRVNGDPKGICNKKGAAGLLQYIETEINDRGMDSVIVSSTGCLKLCDSGPVMVVYPQGDWYGNVDENAVDAILDAIEAGKVCEKYLIS